MSRILINDGNDTELIAELIIATALRDRMRGLLGRNALAENTGLLLLPCRSIHMWFMRFPIDAAFLDEDLNVLRVSRGLRPWQIALAPRRTHSVLETTAGVLAPLQKGDHLVVTS